MWTVLWRNMAGELHAVRSPGEKGGGFDDFSDEAVGGGGSEGGADLANEVVDAGAEALGRGARHREGAVDEVLDRRAPSLDDADSLEPREERVEQDGLVIDPVVGFVAGAHGIVLGVAIDDGL